MRKREEGERGGLMCRWTRARSIAQRGGGGDG